MSRVLAAIRAACWVAWCAALALPVRAQAWNDARARELVERATDRRAQQLADTALRDYHATAHGYLTFLAQVGENFPDPPKVVRSDELALEVYWRAPNLSKQRIVGRRDTLALPTNIAYHQDHLGIVQNNFPSIIRLGDGDEVHDVPHPLSADGINDYDFAIADSLSIRLPGHAVQVYELRVRPRDPAQPRLVGALYIDRESGDVVRMAFTFTRPAYLDKELEDISIVLENALVQGRFWLPLHQEVEIRRTGKWLDFPARGIIRGRWEISGYETNSSLPPAMFAGPEIQTAPPRELRLHEWRGRILDSLPSDVRAATDDDVRKVQEEARALVQQQALARAEGASLSARKVSDFVRVNRVEGLALGAGATLRAGAGIVTTVRGRYGLSDHELKGRVGVALRRGDGRSVELFGLREYRDVGDQAERSTVVNSIASQEFGSDATDPYDVRGGGIVAELGEYAGLRWHIDGAYERQDSLRIRASRPAWGSYERTIPARSLHEERFTLGFVRQRPVMLAGVETRFSGQLRAGFTQPRGDDALNANSQFARGMLSARGERALGTGRLVLEGTIAGLVAPADAPAQELVYLGGAVSGPGYDYHQFAGREGATARIEWRTRVPFFGLSLGPYGRAPASATLAPFATVLYTANAPPFSRMPAGWYPSLGLGALVLFDMVRVDVARGLRRGGWTFSLDVTRDLWSIL